MNYSPPGSSVHEVLQAKILEWVAAAFSGDLSDPGIKPRSPTLQADSLLSEPQWKPIYGLYMVIILNWHKINLNNIYFNMYIKPI